MRWAKQKDKRLARGQLEDVPQLPFACESLRQPASAWSERDHAGRSFSCCAARRGIGSGLSCRPRERRKVQETLSGGLRAKREKKIRKGSLGRERKKEEVGKELGLARRIVASTAEQSHLLLPFSSSPYPLYPLLLFLFLALPPPPHLNNASLSVRSRVLNGPGGAHGRAL